MVGVLLNNQIRVLTAIVLSELLIEWAGYLIGIPFSAIIVLVLTSTVIELLLHIIFYRKFHEVISLKQCLKNYISYVKKTLWFLLMVLLLLIINTVQKHAFLLFFEWHILVMFYTIGFIISSNNIPIKK
ncbi:hypothetical protein A0O21_02140 [Streptococcus pantholopis]|uniref:Bacteriocin secretion protein n=1 Tax=Streptococcus pantholopis TaxID=1811193 RepID=A0A172Q631_9STRE|nr:hypothetical protein A0O21_02140 [Streptococcus pantholopis]